MQTGKHPKVLGLSELIAATWSTPSQTDRRSLNNEQLDARIAMETARIRLMLRTVLLKFWGDRCAYCQVALTVEAVTLDHVHPLAGGGDDHHRNLVPACRACNCEKREQSHRDYLGSLQLRDQGRSLNEFEQKLSEWQGRCAVVSAQPRETHLRSLGQLEARDFFQGVFERFSFTGDSAPARKEGGLPS